MNWCQTSRMIIVIPLAVLKGSTRLSTISVDQAVLLIYKYGCNLKTNEYLFPVKNH